jgi:hypothetical protein
MWDFLRKILARSNVFRAAGGDVVFVTPPVRGQTLHSAFQWRIQRDLDGNSLYIGLKLFPDAWVAVEGQETSYINFDLESAKRVRENLDACIAQYRGLTGFGRVSSGQRNRGVQRSD